MSSAPDRAHPIRVPNRAQAAAQALREAILSGRLQPGDRIVEQQWADALGIGQPTIREALRELEYQGMVVKNPNRGTRVARLQQKDYQQLLDVRIPLEAMAVELAACNLTPADFAELHSLVDEMARAIRLRDLSAFHEKDVAFHRRIWMAAGNPYLASCLESVAFRLFVFSVLGERGRLLEENQDAVRQHRGILAGLESADPEQARRAFLASTTSYWKRHYGFRPPSQ